MAEGARGAPHRSEREDKKGGALPVKMEGGRGERDCACVCEGLRTRATSSSWSKHLLATRIGRRVWSAHAPQRHGEAERKQHGAKRNLGIRKHKQSAASNVCRRDRSTAGCSSTRRTCIAHGATTERLTSTREDGAHLKDR